MIKTRLKSTGFRGHAHYGNRLDNMEASHEKHSVGIQRHDSLVGIHCDYDVELTYQFGNEGKETVKAYMLAAEFGYQPKNLWGNPRLWIGFDLASGDSRKDDEQSNSFDQLFPLGHAFLGYMDIVGRQNILAFNQGISFHPGHRWKIRLANHFFWRESLKDALYNPAGKKVRRAAVGARNYMGSELDLLVSYQMNRHLSASMGYSRFIDGPFIKRSGSSQNIGFFYSSFELMF